MAKYSVAMNKFTKAARAFIDRVNLRQVVRPERLWETGGSRLPLRGVIRLWIGTGSRVCEGMANRPLRPRSGGAALYFEA